MKLVYFNVLQVTQLTTLVQYRNSPSAVSILFFVRAFVTVKLEGFLNGTLQTSAATLVFDRQFESSKLQSAQEICYCFRVAFKYHLKWYYDQEIISFFRSDFESGFA